MHYSRRAFSKNGKDTIKPVTGGKKLGQKNGPSTADIFQINRLYHCHSKYRDFHTPEYYLRLIIIVHESTINAPLTG